jgi:hypothetical protein
MPVDVDDIDIDDTPLSRGFEGSDVEILPKDLYCDCGTLSLDSDCFYSYYLAVQICYPVEGSEVKLHVNYHGGWYNDWYNNGTLICGLPTDGIYGHDDGRTIWFSDFDGVVIYGDGYGDPGVWVTYNAYDIGDDSHVSEGSCSFGGDSHSCLVEPTLNTPDRLIFADVTLGTYSELWGFRYCVNP